jgi:hypothetical protein
MSNPHDIARDHILRHLYYIHENARSPKTAGIKITDLARALKPKGFKLKEVASNLDYLAKKGWVREVLETRTFTTPRGTTQQAEKRSYKISDLGIDHMEAASMYQRSSIIPHINISNIQGVTIVGDGNLVNATLTDFSRALSELKQAILAEPSISDDLRLVTVSDIDSLQSQLQKPNPDKSLIRTLWSSIEKVATVGGAIEFVQKAAELIAPFLK